MQNRSKEQTHYLPVMLKSDKEGWAILSCNPAGKAVVFVHGFAGSSVDTWRHFHSLLPAKRKGDDLLFFGYDGIYASVEASAYELRKFLEMLFRHPRRLLRDDYGWPDDRDADFKYQSVTLVAHSMGAVVARLALLRALQSYAQWTDTVRLALFAPAHLGARVARLLSIGLGTACLGISTILRLSMPPLEELDPAMSDVIVNLQKECAPLIAKGNKCLKAHKVIHAKHEKIVDPNGRFCSDPPSDFVSGTHTSICKPRPGFTHPLRFL